MKKLFRSLATALVVVLAISCVVWAAPQVRAETKTVYYRADLKIVVDGHQKTLDVTPFIIDPGWIMVPAEFISKELGASVAWDDASSTFTITTKGAVAQTEPAPSSPPANDYVVYITATGGKYHSAGCRYLSKSSQAIMKSDAIKRGYGACSVCHP